MAVVFPKPQKEVIFDFVAQNNGISGCHIKFEEIMDTFNKRAYHPYAVGHFNVVSQVWKLVQDPLWIVKHQTSFKDEKNSDLSLNWLREMHRKLMAPVAEIPDIVTDLQPIHASDVGRYRLGPKTVGMDRPLPKPTAIRRLLHHWLTYVGEFHLKMATINSRHTRDTLAQCNDMAYEAHLMLCCIAPFSDGNGRVARFVENCLRLRWGLPWKTITEQGSAKYAKQLIIYEEDEGWQNTLTKLDARYRPY
jgi:hypothetical protein